MIVGARWCACGAIPIAVGAKSKVDGAVLIVIGARGKLGGAIVRLVGACELDSVSAVRRFRHAFGTGNCGFCDATLVTC